MIKITSKPLKIVTLVSLSLSLIIFNLAAPLLVQAQTSENADLVPPVEDVLTRPEGKEGAAIQKYEDPGDFRDLGEIHVRDLIDVGDQGASKPGFLQKALQKASDIFYGFLDFFGLRKGEDIRVAVSFADALERGSNTAAGYNDVLIAVIEQARLTIKALENARGNPAENQIAFARARETLAAVKNQSQKMIDYAAQTENDLNNELSGLVSAGYSQSETNSTLRSFANILDGLRQMRQVASQTNEAAKDLETININDVSTVARYLAGFRDIGDNLEELQGRNANLQKMLAEKTEEQKALVDKDRKGAQEISDSIAQKVQEGQEITEQALNDGVIDKKEGRILNKIATELSKNSDTLAKTTRGMDDETQTNAQDIVNASNAASNTIKGLSQQTNVPSDVAAAVLSDINNTRLTISDKKSVLKKSTEIAKGVELLMSLIMKAAREIRPEEEISQSLGEDSARITGALTGGAILGYAVNNTNSTAKMSFMIEFSSTDDMAVARGEVVAEVGSNTIRPIYAEASTEDQRALTAARQRLNNGSYTISSETQNGGDGVGLLSELPKPLSQDDIGRIRDTVEKVVSGLGMARDMAQQRMERAADLAEQLFSELASFFGRVKNGGHFDKNGVANLPSEAVQMSVLYDNEREGYVFTTGIVDSVNRPTTEQRQNFENQFDCGRGGSASVSGSVFSCNGNAKTAINYVSLDPMHVDIVAIIGQPESDYNSDRQYSYRMNVDNPCAENAGGAILQNYEPLSIPFASLIPRALAYYINDPGGGGGGDNLIKMIDGKPYIKYMGKWHPAVKINGRWLAKVYTGPNQTIIWPKVASSPSAPPPLPPPPAPVGPFKDVPQVKAAIKAAVSKALKGFIKGAGEALAVATGVAILGQGCASEDKESAEEHSEQILQDIADYADEQSQQGNDIEAAAAGVIGAALDALNSIGGGVAVSGLSNLWDFLSGGD